MRGTVKQDWWETRTSNRQWNSSFNWLSILLLNLVFSNLFYSQIDLNRWLLRMKYRVSCWLAFCAWCWGKSTSTLSTPSRPSAIPFTSSIYSSSKKKPVLSCCLYSAYFFHQIPKTKNPPSAVSLTREDWTLPQVLLRSTQWWCWSSSMKFTQKSSKSRFSN